MGIYIGGFGTGFQQGLTSSMSLAKQYQEAQKLRAQQDLAKQMSDYLNGQSGASQAAKPATAAPVDMSNPQGAQIDPPAAGGSAAPAGNSAPAAPAAAPVTPAADTPSLSASISDNGFGNGLNLLNGG